MHGRSQKPRKIPLMRLADIEAEFALRNEDEEAEPEDAQNKRLRMTSSDGGSVTKAKYVPATLPPFPRPPFLTHSQLDRGRENPFTYPNENHARSVYRSRLKDKVAADRTMKLRYPPRPYLDYIRSVNISHPLPLAERPRDRTFFVGRHGLDNATAEQLSQMELVLFEARRNNKTPHQLVLITDRFYREYQYAVDRANVVHLIKVMLTGMYAEKDNTGVEPGFFSTRRSDMGSEMRQQENDDIYEIVCAHVNFLRFPYIASSVSTDDSLYRVEPADPVVTMCLGFLTDGPSIILDDGVATLDLSSVMYTERYSVKINTAARYFKVRFNYAQLREKLRNNPEKYQDLLDAARENPGAPTGRKTHVQTIRKRNPELFMALMDAWRRAGTLTKELLKAQQKWLDDMKAKINHKKMSDDEKAEFIAAAEEEAKYYVPDGVRPSSYYFGSRTFARDEASDNIFAVKHGIYVPDEARPRIEVRRLLRGPDRPIFVKPKEELAVEEATFFATARAPVEVFDPDKYYLGPRNYQNSMAAFMTPHQRIMAEHEEDFLAQDAQPDFTTKHLKDGKTMKFVGHGGALVRSLADQIDHPSPLPDVVSIAMVQPSAFVKTIESEQEAVDINRRLLTESHNNPPVLFTAGDVYFNRDGYLDEVGRMHLGRAIAWGHYAKKLVLTKGSNFPSLEFRERDRDEDVPTGSVIEGITKAYRRMVNKHADAYKELHGVSLEDDRAAYYRDLLGYELNKDTIDAELAARKAIRSLNLFHDEHDKSKVATMPEDMERHIKFARRIMTDFENQKRGTVTAKRQQQAMRSAITRASNRNNFPIVDNAKELEAQFKTYDTQVGHPVCVPRYLILWNDAMHQIFMNYVTGGKPGGKRTNKHDTPPKPPTIALTVNEWDNAYRLWAFLHVKMRFANPYDPRFPVPNRDDELYPMWYAVHIAIGYLPALVRPEDDAEGKQEVSPPMPWDEYLVADGRANPTQNRREFVGKSIETAQRRAEVLQQMNEQGGVRRHTAVTGGVGLGETTLNALRESYNRVVAELRKVLKPLLLLPGHLTQRQIFEDNDDFDRVMRWLQLSNSKWAAEQELGFKTPPPPKGVSWLQRLSMQRDNPTDMYSVLENPPLPQVEDRARSESIPPETDDGEEDDNDWWEGVARDPERVFYFPADYVPEEDDDDDDDDDIDEFLTTTTTTKK